MEGLPELAVTDVQDVSRLLILSEQDTSALQDVMC